MNGGGHTASPPSCILQTFVECSGFATRPDGEPRGGTLQLKIRGGGGGGEAGSIVWGLRFWLENIFWRSSKILIWTIVKG